MNRKTLIRIYFLFALCFAGAAASSPVFGTLGTISSATDGKKWFTGEPGVVVAQASEKTAPASGKAKLLEVLGLKTAETGNGVSVTLEATDNIQYTVFKLANPSRLILDLPQMRPGILKDSVSVNQGVVGAIRSMYFEEAEVLRLEISLNGGAVYDVSKPDKKTLQINFQPVAEEVPKPAAVRAERVEASSQIAAKTGVQNKADPKPDPVAKGNALDRAGENAVVKDSCAPILEGDKEKVSFDFQQARLKNILRIIAEVSGLNIVISPDVDGLVTMRLINVPWNMALDMVLKNNALGKECVSNIVRIASQSTFAKEESNRNAANTVKKQIEIQAREAGKVITETARLSYANLAELTTNLTKLVSPSGKITTDARTNTVIMTDFQPIVSEMLRLVKTVDIQTPQVMIEARIVEVNKSATKELGIQWGATLSRITSKEFPNVVTLGPSTRTTPGFIVDLPTTSAAAGGLGLSLGSLTRDTILDIQLTALETQGRGRVLSSPKVTTVDNREAKIQSGRRIPYQTVSQEGTKTEFAEAAINLTVTPHITVDGKVYMKILAQKNAADFSRTVNGIPTITTKETSTEVLLRDGETTVLGGLYESTITESRNQIPGFAKIPWLGWLFRKSNDVDQVDELLIFITPIIVKNTGR